jgi:hypothetical protein
MSPRRQWTIVALLVALLVAVGVIVGFWLLGGSTPTSATVAVTTACVQLQNGTCAPSGSSLVTCPVVTTPLGAAGVLSLATMSGVGLLVRSRRRRQRAAVVGGRGSCA